MSDHQELSANDLEYRLARRKMIREKRMRQVQGETIATEESNVSLDPEISFSPTARLASPRLNRVANNQDEVEGSSSEVKNERRSHYIRTENLEQETQESKSELENKIETGPKTDSVIQLETKVETKVKTKLEETSEAKPLEPIMNNEAHSNADESTAKEKNQEKKPTLSQKKIVESNPTKNNSSFDDSYNAGERLYNKGKYFLAYHEQKMEGQRKKRREEEAFGLTFKPVISKKAQTIMKKDDYYGYNNEWKKKVEEEVQKKREAKRLEEDKDSKPYKLEMNSKSKLIIDKRKKENRYNGPISGWEKRFDEYQTSHKNIPSEELSFSPRINSHSRKLTESKPTGENTFERLYNHSNNKKCEEHFEEEKRSPQLKSEHDMNSFVQYMLSKGEEIERKKSEYKSKIEKEAVCNPSLNEISLRIAKQNSRKPLYSPTSSSSRLIETLVNSSRRAGNKMSASVTISMDDFMQRTAAQEKIKRERINFIKRMQEEQELKECTFKPMVNKKSKILALNFLADENDDYDDYEEYESDEDYDFETNIYATTSMQSSPRTPVQNGKSFLPSSKQNSTTSLKRQTAPFSPLTKKALSRSNLLVQRQMINEQDKEQYNRKVHKNEDEDEYLKALEQEMIAALDDWNRLEQMQL